MFKFIFSGLLSVVIGAANAQQSSQGVFKVTPFTQVPKDMEGCGENLFLSKSDEKSERFIFYTDYVRGLICVNNKMILVTRPNKSMKSTEVFSNKDYVLTIKYGQKKASGDESYEIKNATLTLSYHSKIVWTQTVIGGGGC